MVFCSFFSFFKCIDVSHCLYFKFNMCSIIRVVRCALRRCALLDSYFNNDFFYATKTSCISTKKPQLLLVWFQFCELDFFLFRTLLIWWKLLQLCSWPILLCGVVAATVPDQGTRSRSFVSSSESRVAVPSLCFLQKPTQTRLEYVNTTQKGPKINLVDVNGLKIQVWNLTHASWKAPIEHSNRIQLALVFRN